MPAISAAKIQEFGVCMPEVSVNNTTVLTQIQVKKPLEDSEKALLVLTEMGFALGGKKTDNSVVLSEGYGGKTNPKGKPGTAKPGPSVAFMGLLHMFLLGRSLQETIWLNLFTQQQITDTNMFPGGVGKPPWEDMPAGESCEVAERLKESLIGRLIPLSRFCLLIDDGLHYSEGLFHPGYKDGVTDPTCAIDYSGKEPKALWVNPEKRPWRELTALLGFIGQDSSHGFNSMQISCGLDRARDVTESFGIWSGGLRVSSNAGEQYVAGNSDFVESTVYLQADSLGELWFSELKKEMEALDGLAKTLYARVIAFFKEQLVDGKQQAAQATNMFWQLCERDFQQLVDACGNDSFAEDGSRNLRRRFASYSHQVFDEKCPNESARQLDAWAKFRSNNGKYLIREA